MFIKRLAGLLLLLGVFQVGEAQTRLKANMLYWGVGITNASVETKLAKHWTFNGELVYSPWKSVDGNHFEFLQIIPEARYYVKSAFDGFYIGGYGSFQVFNMTKWNYWNLNKYQKGRGFSLGLNIGYAYSINARWGIDLYIGGGWQNSQYKGYDTQTHEMYRGWNGSGEWMPYRLGVTLTYQL